MSTTKQEVVLTAREALLVEEITNCLVEIRQATMDSEHGQAISVCENLTVETLRKLGPKLIENALQAKIDDAEKKGRRAGRAVGKTRKVRGRGRPR